MLSIMPVGSRKRAHRKANDFVRSRLPDGQLALIDAVVSVVRPSTKVVVVLFNGGGLAIEKSYGKRTSTYVREVYLSFISRVTESFKRCLQYHTH